MKKKHLKICFKILSYWFSDLLKNTYYKFIALNGIVLSDNKKLVYSIDIFVRLSNDYYFRIYLDFVEQRFSVSAYNDNDLNYKTLSGNLNTFCVTCYY